MSADQKIIRLTGGNGTLAVYVQHATDQAYGTLLCVHGGPNGDYRGNDDVFEQLAAYAPGLGFNVVQFDMFGAGASDGGQADITLETQVRDYETVFAYAREQLGVPVHVVGESMGATIVAMRWDMPVKSHILLWPAFDLRDTDLEPYFSAEWRTVAERDGFIDDDGTILGRPFLQELLTFDFEPCFELPACACLLVHGKGDAAVPFRQSLKAVQAARGEAVLFAHPTGDHGLQAVDEREFVHDAIRWWLERAR